MAKKIRIIPELDDSKILKQLRNLGNRREKIKVDVDSGNVRNANQQMQQLVTTTANSNTTFKKLKNTISNTFSSGRITMTAFLTVLHEISKAGKEAKKTIQDIDKAITDLSIATNMSRESTAGLVKEYNNYAKELKSTTLNITDSADDYLRSGKSMKETQALIKDSIMLSKLGQIEASESTNALLSTMNAYDMSIEQVDRALDAMVAIDMKAATSAGEIASALKYCASNADLAGLSFNNLISIISTIQHKTGQAAEVVGTTMNTVLSRYKNVKLGNVSDEDGEDISNVETSLKSLGIQLRNSAHDFKDFDEVYHEVAKNWTNYTEVQQASIAKELGGVRQMNRVIAMFEGYNKVLELTEVAASSAGVALDKFNNSYVNSLEAKENELQASFESMIVNSDVSEVYSGIIDATTSLAEFMDSTNALKGVMSGLALSGGIKFFLALRTGINESYISLNKFGNALNIVKQTRISTTDFDRLLLLTNGLSDSQMKMILSSKKLSMQQKELLLVNSGLSIEEAKLKLQTLGLATAQTGLTAVTTTLGNAFKGLIASMAAQPIMLITMLISGTVMAYQSYNQKLEEARQKNIEASETAIEHADSLRELYGEYVRLSSVQNRTSSEEEEFKTVIEDVTKALGDKAKVLENLTAGTNEYADALANATKEELQSASVDATIGRKSAEEKLQADIWSELGGSKVSVDSNSKGKAISDEAQKAVDIVSDVLKDFQTVNRTWDNLSWDISTDSPEEALEYYNALLKAREELVLASKNDEILLDTEIYKDMNSALSAMEESLDAYITKRYEEEKLNYMAIYGIPQTVDEYNSMQEALVKTASASHTLQDKFKTLLMSDFSRLVNEIESIADAQKEVQNVTKNLDEPTTPITFDASTFSESVKGLSSLQDAYNDFYTKLQDGENFTFEISDIESLREAFGETCAEFETFEKLATSASTSADDLQKSFDKLATEYIFGTNLLDGLNTNTREQILSQLELQGVVGASSIITKEFAQAFSDATLANIDFANATNGQINAILLEGQYAEETVHKIYAYTIQKRIANENSLSTVTDIAELEALCKNLGIATESLMWFARAKNLQIQIDNGNDSDLVINQLNIAKNKCKELASQVAVTAGAYTGMEKSATNASKSASKSADAYLEAYNKELAELDHLHELGIISDREYYEKLNALNEKYFNNSAKNHEKYLDKYRENQEKVYKGLKDLLKDLLNEQRDLADSAISAVTSSLDDEIDKLNKQKDVAVESYEKQIDAIDEKIKKLEDENDEIKRQRELEDALYKQRQSQNQKSRVYKQVDATGAKSQVVYEADTRAISEANDAVDEAKDNIYIAGLEKQKESLQEKLDTVSEAYDKQIEKLTDYKERWEDIANAYENEQNRMIASAIMGSNWESNILSMRLDTLSNFKTGYMNICAELNAVEGSYGINSDKVAEDYATSIQNMLVKTQTLDTVLNGWKGFTSDLNNVIGLGSGVGFSSFGTTNTSSINNNTGKSSMSGAGSDSIVGAVQTGGDEVATTLNEQWIPAFEGFHVGVNSTCKNIVADIDEMNAKIVASCNSAINALKALSEAKSGNGYNTVSYSPVSFTGSLSAHANGTDGAIKKDEKAVIGELGAEGLVRNGEFTLIGQNGAEVQSFKRGDIIFNAEQTKSLLKNGHINSRGKVIGSYANGTIDSDNLITWNSEAFMNNFLNKASLPEINIPHFDSTNIVPKNAETNITQNINVTLPNVTNETGFKNFEKQIKQMKNDALQRSHRRN